ncbi:MAG: PrsW family glutamic-type intramembrane protease [Bacteroidota bacterium]
MQILLLLVAIFPGLLISYAAYRYDSKNVEPRPLLIGCFILGMLITLPAMKLQSMEAILGWEDMTQLVPLLLSSFVLVAFTEELVKFLCLLLIPYRQKYFDEPLDGIIYALMIGMGFATLENILYANQYGLETTLIRAFTAVPAHGVFAVITGYYTGLAKFDPKRKYQLLAIGFGLAVLIHGLYDFFILQEYYDWLMTLSTLTLAVSIYFSFKMIRIHKIRSEARIADANTNAIILDDDFNEDVLSEMKRLDEEE